LKRVWGAGEWYKGRKKIFWINCKWEEFDRTKGENLQNKVIFFRNGYDIFLPDIMGKVNWFWGTDNYRTVPTVYD
jgi:hypothetical protein